MCLYQNWLSLLTICMYVRMYVCMYVIYVCIHICIGRLLQDNIKTEWGCWPCVCMYVCMYTYIYIYIYIYTYIHTYTHTHTNIYIYPCRGFMHVWLCMYVYQFFLYIQIQAMQNNDLLHYSESIILSLVKRNSFKTLIQTAKTVPETVRTMNFFT